MFLLLADISTARHFGLIRVIPAEGKIYTLSEIRDISESDGFSSDFIIREIKNGRATILRNLKRNIKNQRL
jgi:hypothetical protein